MGELRGKIVSVYGTLKKFADALGWSRRKVSYIVNKKQEPTASEIQAMAIALHVEVPEEFRVLFLS